VPIISLQEEVIGFLNLDQGHDDPNGIGNNEHSAEEDQVVDGGSQTSLRITHVDKIAEGGLSDEEDGADDLGGGDHDGEDLSQGRSPFGVQPPDEETHGPHPEDLDQADQVHRALTVLVPLVDHAVQSEDARVVSQRARQPVHEDVDHGPVHDVPPMRKQLPFRLGVPGLLLHSQ